MDIKAIVYTSNTGFTKRYAEMLAGKLNMPCYELKESEKHLCKGDTVIYMGWLCAGKAAGYEDAQKRYTIPALCAVGMGSPCEKIMNETIERNEVKNGRVFYLQGGFDMNKLKGVYKLMMKTMRRTVGAALEKKADKTDEEIKMYDMFVNGGDYVDEKNLRPILDWVENA